MFRMTNNKSIEFNTKSTIHKGSIFCYIHMPNTNHKFYSLPMFPYPSGTAMHV